MVFSMLFVFFFFKQKTAYEMRISDWSSDVCSSDLLEGKGVHVVTVNDYLASRDCDWMGRVYRFLGLTTGVIVPNLREDERRQAYAADITYATNNELGFDYLRDNMKYERGQMVQRPFNFAIVDEVDSIDRKSTRLNSSH